ncbi:hypothetical protein FRB94_006183 [Tulasnella sp. JGI-2019a]|nr:hypothetical protein FRB94_006183 [Tulasnella sp. JGI-2019a]
MSGPHIALSVPELFLGILEHLSTGELEAAALVCKAWLAPAVDTKWRTQSVKLSCLLSNLAPIERSQFKNRGALFVLAPKTPITHDHWHRFLEQYANRITRLVFDMQLDEASIGLISALLERFGGHFGYNLISLGWSYGTHNGDCTGTLINLLPGTRLQEVDFCSEEQFYLTGTSSLNPLSQLSHRAPHISKLENVFNSFDFSVFPQLRYLSHCGFLSTSDYHNLLYSQDLTVLFLRWTKGQVTPFHGTNATFLHLERLGFHSPDDEAEEMVIRSVMPALRFLKYFKRGVIGPFTLTLLNNILRTSPLLGKISIVAVVPSQLELVEHHGVRSLSFNGSYHLRSPLETADVDLLAVSRFFPTLGKLAALQWNGNERRV